MTSKKIGFIGLGLIGGSIAKAIRQYYPEYDIIAFDKNKESLALAVQEGTIHTACSSIDDNFRGCTYIFLCAPVNYNAAYLSQLKSLIDSDCILTDVGSVKTSIHKEVIRLGMEESFIGGHPMAGSEKSGFMNSKAHLIENAYFHARSTKPLECTLSSTEDAIKFCIRDYGTGIAPDRLSGIFDAVPSAPSSAASTVDIRKGMGIGLSICKAIVNAHNGEITARNLTEGAEFCFTIPKEEIHHETYDPNPRH